MFSGPILNFHQFRTPHTTDITFRVAADALQLLRTNMPLPLSGTDLIKDEVATAWWARNGSSAHPEHNSRAGNARHRLYSLATFALSLCSSCLSSLSVSDNLRTSLPSFTLFYSRFSYSFLTSFPSAAKNQWGADKTNAWLLTTISPIHICGVNLTQNNFLIQYRQCTYNSTLWRNSLIQFHPQESACVAI